MMLPFGVRKFISTWHGLMLLFAAPFFSLIFWLPNRHQFDPALMVFGALISSLFGLLMAWQFRKQFGSFMDSVDDDEFRARRAFGKLFKKEELPKAKAQQGAYAEYLQQLQGLYERSRTKGFGRVASMAFVYCAALICALFTDGMTFGRLCAVFVLVMIPSSIYINKKKLAKIKRLQERLAK